MASGVGSADDWVGVAAALHRAIELATTELLGQDDRHRRAVAFTKNRPELCRPQARKAIVEPIRYVASVRVGIDTSGKFSTNHAVFTSTVVAAAVGPDQAFDEIAGWTDAALARWGIADRFSELHAKKLRSHEKVEICRMLAERGDLRLSAVVTDPGLLGSSAAVARHRERQYERAVNMDPQTAEGEERQRDLLALLHNTALHDDEYLLAACLPLALAQITQRAFGFFAADAYRADMAELMVRIDEEAAPTVRYGGGALLPTLGGDERFRLTTPLHWRDEPMHPLLARAGHPDGDGYWPQMLFDDVQWVSSANEPAVQIADVLAWVLARRINEPTEPVTAECFELLAPLLAGEHGMRFELFSIPPIREDQTAMYAHLQQGEQPEWWLQPVAT